MNPKELDVGIVGYGIVGQRRRVFIDNHPYLKTVAVCDVRFQKGGSMVDGAKIKYTYNLLEIQSRTKKLTGTKDDGIHYFNNYGDLLSGCKLDILFVCVPNYLAPEVTIAGLENGLHVFCEKPPGRTVDEMRRVIDVENKFPKLKLKYGFNHRYHGSVKKTKEIIDTNKYGDIINFRGVYGKSSIVPFTGQWRAEKKYSGGGILLDQGIHMLDMFRYFCGDFEEVKSFVSNGFWGHNVEDNAYALMRDMKGRVAFIHSSATQWQHSFRLEITLEGAFLELSGILSGSKSYGEEKLLIVPKQEESINGSLSEERTQFLEDNSWKDEIAEFADLIINNKPVLQGSSYDALKVMELVHQIYEADDKWKSQNINESQKSI
jgi:predicted dehydrogenase